MQLAIDAGHGYVKALSSRGGRCVFPALIHPAPATVDLGDFAGTALTRIEGDAYLVGQSAQRLAAPLWSRDKAVDTDTLRLILVAAARLGAMGPVRLATGLPLAWYGAGRQGLQKALQGYGGTVVLPNGDTHRLWFESVVVLPQGVAAAGPVLDQDAYAAGPYLIVDVGYRTTDFIVVTKQSAGSLDFDPLAAGSLEIGMHTVYSTLAQHLTDTHQTVFTAAQVAAGDSLVVRGRRIEIIADRTAQETRVARSIVQGLLAKLDSQMDQVLGLVAVGGGSNLLAQAIPGVIQPPEPQWANTRGYLAALLAMEGLRGRLSGMNS